MKALLEHAQTAWDSGDRETALKLLTEIVKTDPANDAAWRLLHIITAQIQTLDNVSVPKALRWIERLVAEKRVVEVVIDAFSVDEEAHIFELYWQGGSHWVFSFDSIQRSATLFCPEAEEGARWLRIPLTQVRGFSGRPAAVGSLELVLECEGSEVYLGTTADFVGGSQWLAGANELLAFHKNKELL